MSASDLADQLVRRATSDRRIIVAIAGPPGSGKSTLAEIVHDELTRRSLKSAVVPMDGFHMDNEVLRQKGLLARKGAPETFDTRGLLDIVRALRCAEGEVLVPVFDRERELSIAAARAVPPEARFLLLEGNYILLDHAPWSDLAELIDVSVLLLPDEPVLEERLMRRWLDLGMDGAQAMEKVHRNDLPNGRLVRARSQTADFTLK